MMFKSVMVVVEIIFLRLVIAVGRRVLTVVSSIIYKPVVSKLNDQL